MDHQRVTLWFLRVLHKFRMARIVHHQWREIQLCQVAIVLVLQELAQVFFGLNMKHVVSERRSQMVIPGCRNDRMLLVFHVFVFLNKSFLRGLLFFFTLSLQLVILRLLNYVFCMILYNCILVH